MLQDSHNGRDEAPPYSRSAAGGLEQTGQAGNEQDCLCIARKSPDHSKAQRLSSLQGDLPEDPLCSLMLVAVRCRVQSAGMGFNTDFGCFGLDCLSFAPCSLHCQFCVGCLK